MYIKRILQNKQANSKNWHPPPAAISGGIIVKQATNILNADFNQQSDTYEKLVYNQFQYILQ